MSAVRSSSSGERAPAHIGARSRTLVYSRPRKLTHYSRREFMWRKRAEYRRSIVGEATIWQRSTIESMLRLEWAAIEAEHKGDLLGYREMREHSRLLERMQAAF